jgi:PAS domain S-box-containing protein
MELTRIADHIARGADPGDEQFRLLVSSVTDCAICLLDSAGRVVSWNAGAERIKGYAADEVLGRHFSLFYPAEDRAAGKPEHALAAAARAGSFEGEGWRLRKDGSRFWAEVTVTALRDADGALNGYAKVTRDMTARHFEREREQLFAATFDSAAHGITVADPAGHYLGANAAFQQLVGYSDAELRAKTIFDLTHADDVAAIWRAFEAIVTGAADRMEFDKRYVRKDGNVIWAHVSVTRIVDDEGRVTRLVAQAEDITESRAAEEAVRTSQARLQAFTDNSPNMMWLKDRDGRYRFANAGFLEYYGLQSEQVIGQRDAQLFPPAQARAMSAHDAEVMARDGPIHFEQASRQGGVERVSLVIKFPVAGGVGAVATDITDRRLTEQALREQRTLLAEAQKVAGLGSWEWDPESGRLLWSDELYRIYGVAPEGFRPSFEGYLERVHPEDRQNSGALMARALMDGRGFTMEERILRPGGEIRYLRSHGEVARNERGKPLKILGACLDVTEQHHSESALRQAAQDLHALTRKLVEAEEAERRRIARELHDRVGQALSALNINLDIVLKDDALAPAPKKRLEDSLGLVERTLESIENVMADLRPPLLDEYGLAAALGWHAEEFSRRTDIEVRIADHSPEARSLRLDAALALYRIAQEALNNVLKHAHARNVRIEISTIDNHVTLAVQDDGQGFDPAKIRAGRWGMTAMRERAAAAGGELSLESAAGRGTCVRVRVPL